MSPFAWTVIGAGVLFLLLTWAAILDLAFRDFGSMARKAAWGFCVFVPFFGPLVYFAFGMRQGTRASATARCAKRD
ncbi:MAG: PLDc_N domain-containing protein [Deltaproteobacteria bacterium]|nr:PLDc_N domain-containing protein [Deltaproteobacteria bacterium]